jgi:hypothetical protein
VEDRGVMAWKCFSLILCQQVEVDPQSGRPTVVDVIQEFVVSTVPAVEHQLVVWAEVAGDPTREPFEMLVTRGSDAWAGALELARGRVDAAISRPGQFRTLLFILVDLPLVAPGPMRFQLICGSTVIMERDVLVVLRRPGIN